MKTNVVSKWKTYITLFVFLQLCINLCLAQNHLVSGFVTNYGEGLVGVNVILKNGNIGTITNIDGSYEITVNPNDTLIFSYTGFKKIEISIENRSVINVVLQENTTELDEIIVVGYGTQKK